MLWVIIVILFAIVLFQFLHNCHFKRQIQDISDILDEIREGNLDRRLLAYEKTILSEIVYKINDIVIENKEKLLEKDKSERAYKQLVTSLSHDIRTPLASLTGYLEVLESNSVTDEEHDKFLYIAKTKADTLSDYIQTLFEWLKLESGEWVYHFKEVNICELTRVILADWIIKLEKSKMNFLFEIPENSLYLITDKSAYERILNNLLTNIVRHSHADFLKIRLYESDDTFNISICDNGVGIPEKDIPFIFERLYKCDCSRSENSNGLGLSIVKELTGMLNGRINVESHQGSGTTFKLKFSKNMNFA